MAGVEGQIMRLLETRTSSTADPVLCDPYRSMSPATVFEEESAWRRLPRGRVRSMTPRAVVTRWRALEEVKRDVSAKAAADHHVVAIVLRNENISFSVAGRTVHDGPVAPGMLHVSPPGMSTRCLFRGPYDVLHLHVPGGLISEVARDAAGHDRAELPSWTTLRREPRIGPLARALLEAENIGGSFGCLYADYIGVAVVALLLGSVQCMAPPGAAGLSTWRMKRAIEYIEANLAEPVSSADIASAAGLTRMHFAAQFRARTGLRPHEYLLRRRIERAQQLLGKPDVSVVNVALAVGFQNQSHFTNIFKRFVGQTPRMWRHSQVGSSR
jgi:AraC-like DNA-binding protein